MSRVNSLFERIPSQAWLVHQKWFFTDVELSLADKKIIHETRIKNPQAGHSNR